MSMAKWKSALLCMTALAIINIDKAFAVDERASEMTLIEAIEQISVDYGVYFTFDKNLVKDIQVNYEANKSKSVEDAVSRILQHTSLSYKLFNQQFLIIYKNDEEGLKTLRRMSKYLDKLIRDEEKAI